MKDIDKLKFEITNAIRSTLVIQNDQSTHIAVDKIIKIIKK